MGWTRNSWKSAALAAMGAAAVAGAAGVPHWWTQGVVDPLAMPGDFAVANQGQAKWMALKAKEALDAALSGSGGAGAEILARIAAFSPTNNYLPINAGQLKYLAEPFYARLAAVGWTNAFPHGMTGAVPWTTTTEDDAHYALVNLGQLIWVEPLGRGRLRRFGWGWARQCERMQVRNRPAGGGYRRRRVERRR